MKKAETLFRAKITMTNGDLRYMTRDEHRNVWCVNCDMAELSLTYIGVPYDKVAECNFELEDVNDARGFLAVLRKYVPEKTRVDLL